MREADILPGLIYDDVDLETGMNFDVVPHTDGAVEVRVFAPYKATTSRRVILNADRVKDLIVALAGHLRAAELRERLDVLDEQLMDAKVRIDEQAAQIRRLTATPELRRTQEAQRG